MAALLALIVGTPWGQLTQGGYADGALPIAGRIFAIVSVIIIALFALGQLGRVGWGPLRNRRRLATGLTWAALVYSDLGVGMNLASQSALVLAGTRQNAPKSPRDPAAPRSS